MVRPHVQGPRITRREAMRLLGFGAGASVLALVDPLQAVTSAAFQPGRSARLPSFPSGAIIRTLLNDIAPEAMGAGAVLFHEHLSARWGRPQHFTDDVGLIAEEVRSSGTDGIACIVDAGHPDIGRNIDALRRIATESGIPIVARPLGRPPKRRAAPPARRTPTHCPGRAPSLRCAALGAQPPGRARS